MSCYTEFQTKEIILRKDTPHEVIEFLERCFNEDTWKAWEIAEGSGSSVFAHEFFKQERWMRVFQEICFPDMLPNYLSPYLKKKGNYWALFLWTDINYGIDEIEEFVKWITPYITGHKEREYIGWRRTETIVKLNIYIERPRRKLLPDYIRKVVYPIDGLPF